MRLRDYEIYVIFNVICTIRTERAILSRLRMTKKKIEFTLDTT